MYDTLEDGSASSLVTVRVYLHRDYVAAVQRRHRRHPRVPDQDRVHAKVPQRRLDVGLRRRRRRALHREVAAIPQGARLPHQELRQPLLCVNSSVQHASDCLVDRRQGQSALHQFR